MKQCCWCHKRKPLEAFYRATDRKDGRQTACKECRRARSRTPEARERHRAHAVRRRWGLSLEEYDEIRAAGCAICGRTEPLSQLCFDHDHTNGRLRAVLCKDCNVALGRFHDDPARMRAAADYIEEWQRAHA